MKLSRQRRPFRDVDVTSFSDLAFLLIIFFVLTTSFVTRMGIPASIPSSTSDPKQKREQETPTVNLSSDQLLFNQKEVSIEEFRHRLGAMKLPDRKPEERIIILDSAPDVTFERYYRVITAISKAGGVLALVERPEEAAKP